MCASDSGYDERQAREVLSTCLVYAAVFLLVARMAVVVAEMVWGKG